MAMVILKGKGAATMRERPRGTFLQGKRVKEMAVKRIHRCPKVRELEV